MQGNGTDCADIDECRQALTCDPRATCTNSAGGFECTCPAPNFVGDGRACVCADGYVEDGGECIGDNGTACANAGGCASGHCVDEICCESACDAPGECELAEGATCADGATCVYAEKADDATCDDGDACTLGDACDAGVCTASSTPDCDDDNVCTEDTCDPGFGCENDGRDVADTTVCGTDDACGTDYRCASDRDGTCIPDVLLVDCSVQDSWCRTHACDPSDGSCDPTSIREGESCDDGDGCTTSESCNSGLCNGSTPVDCGADTECTMEVCSSGACHTELSPGSCDDDDPCTESDQCAITGCDPGSPKDCSGQDDQCNVGICDPSDGSCDKMPVTNNTPCDDGNSCSLEDTCQSGVCTPTSLFDACGVYATGCSEGSPNVCTCAMDYVSSQGMCVPNVNECAGDCSAVACSANATCNDPTANCGDRTCTCNAGYTGSGLTCMDIDECAGNPCGAGRGSCAQNSPGAGYACTCNVGFTSVDGATPGVNDPTCVCDMNGTFAIRIRTDVSWPAAIDNSTGSPIVVVAAGMATLDSWAIRNHTYNASGSLQATTIPCGGQTPDVCGTGNGGVAAEAYSQFLANQIWGSSGLAGTMPTENLTISIPNALAEQAFTTPRAAVVVGLHLTNPLGTWPSAHSSVGTVGSPGTNGSYWLDHDNDTKRAVTSFAAFPGGTPVDNVYPDPLAAYGTTSASCQASGHGTLSYNWWPVPAAFACDEGFLNAVCRVKEFHVASRTISELSGTFASCDVIAGDVTGPRSGQMQNDARVGGCRRRTGGIGSATDTACTEAMYDWVDDQPQTQTINDASFIIRRVPANLLTDGVTCAEVRGMTF